MLRAAGARLLARRCGKALRHGAATPKQRAALLAERGPGDDAERRRTYWNSFRIIWLELPAIKTFTLLIFLSCSLVKYFWSPHIKELSFSFVS